MQLFYQVLEHGTHVLNLICVKDGGLQEVKGGNGSIRDGLLVFCKLEEEGITHSIDRILEGLAGLGVLADLLQTASNLEKSAREDSFISIKEFPAKVNCLSVRLNCPHDILLEKSDITKPECGINQEV